MASPSEPILECKPDLNSYSMLLKSFGDHHQALDQTKSLEDVLARLEEKRFKIEVFKSELPLCMQLLTNAVEASRKQLLASRSANQGPRPVLEEFIPLKNSAPGDSDKCSNIYCDKANWMASAQLWNQTAATDHNHETKPESKITSPTPCEENDASIGFHVLSPNLTLDTEPRNGGAGGGAFLPFSKEGNPTLRSLSDLAQLAQKMKISLPALNKEKNPITPLLLLLKPLKEKLEGVWSPDLHHRFVNALQMLGRSQAATPKQIRELMKVDGLTNDEVKSHLQKYRLHTRRPSPIPQAPGGPAPQLVVLCGIWVPPEYATAAAPSGVPALYGTALLPIRPHISALLNHPGRRTSTPPQHPLHQRATTTTISSTCTRPTHRPPKPRRNLT